MPKPPSEDRVKEYDENRQFCEGLLVILEQLDQYAGKQTAFPLELAADAWRDGNSAFGVALSSMKMLCRDLLEATQDYQGDVAKAIDKLLMERGKPTLSFMRAKNWNLVPKILKRGRIRDDDEFYLAKSIVDSLDISEKQQERLLRLLSDYEFRP